MTERFFEHLRHERCVAICNSLLESPFYYRTDDVELFDYLRRHRAEFERFFEHHFGWALYVDERVARVIKSRTYNTELPSQARDAFELSRRDEVVLFLLLLELAERLEREAARDPALPRRFLLSAFVRIAIGRLRELLGPAAPGDRAIFAAVGALFEKLVRHRLVRLVEDAAPDADDDLPDGMDRLLLYEVLPGLTCYEPSRLVEPIVREAYLGRSVTPEREEEAT